MLLWTETLQLEPSVLRANRGWNRGSPGHGFSETDWKYAQNLPTQKKYAILSGSVERDLNP